MPRLGALLLSLLLVPAGLVALPASAADHHRPPTHAATYTNPVTAGTVDTFPDPTTIRAHDGHWYAYGTTNPIFNSAGETGEHILPTLRSDDLTHWSYVGDAIALDAKPAWWPAGTRAWAPDIRYLDGTYYLTYALSTGGVALMTSAGPTGPWADHGLLVPGGNSGCPTGNIDQAMLTDTDGTHYLYWGSYDTICVSAMNANATALVGPITQIGHGRRMEGAYVVHRDGFYYLFYSDGGCCDGAFSGYTVKVGRATSPTGPFLTPSGDPLTDRRSHDGIVLASTANGWDGPGHNAVATDLAGQDWLVYHAIPEADPDFPAVDGAGGGTLRLTKRPMLVDRLDWIDGWPVVNAGAGPSATRTEAPVTAYLSGSTVSGTTSRTKLSQRSVPGDIRVEGSLTGDGAGLVVGGATAWLRGGQLVVEARGSRTVTADLPDGFDHATPYWVVAERRRGRLHVEVSADRLHDAVASADVELAHRARAGHVGVAATHGAVSASLVGAARLYRPVTERVADPRVGRLLPSYSDELDGSGAPETGDPAWSWVRRPAAAPVESDGSLVWPTQAGDLNGTSNNAPVLLRDAPAGDFTVETKLTFDGTRGNQQAGLVLYDTDDRYLKLTHSVLPLTGVGGFTHVTEFLKEGPRPTYSLPTPVFAGPMFGGPPAATTWLRLRYTYDAVANAHDVRMASSTDGTHWTWGGSWSLPRTDSRPLRIGLVSMNTAGATARFDYVRTYANR
jgi:arabinan endo-1,5-alpha-L-arabinosidase